MRVGIDEAVDGGGHAVVGAGIELAWREAPTGAAVQPGHGVAHGISHETTVPVVCENQMS